MGFKNLCGETEYFSTKFIRRRLPNQELSGAKSELQGGTVGVCSSYKRSGQTPCSLPPNQELSEAKSELRGEMVGVCSFYKRDGQPSYNTALRNLQMCLLVHV